MTYGTLHTVELQCHPVIRAQSVRGIQVQVGWGPGGVLKLTFSLTGDLVRLRIPTLQPSRRADGLWQHTCFNCRVLIKSVVAQMKQTGTLLRSPDCVAGGIWGSETEIRDRDRDRKGWGGLCLLSLSCRVLDFAQPVLSAVEGLHPGYSSA